MKMSKLKTLLLALIIHSLLACGQSNSDLTAQVSTQSTNSDLKDLEEFIPNGYTILDSSSGNLNLDEYPDLILILKKEGEEKTSDVINDPEERPLLILTGKANGNYKLSASSKTCVYCIDCGGVLGDPYQEITINNGTFSVHHYGGSAWRWTRIITFKYSPKDNYWFFYSDKGENFHATEPEKIESYIITEKDLRKLRLEEFDIFAATE